MEVATGMDLILPCCVSLASTFALLLFSPPFNCGEERCGKGEKQKEEKKGKVLVHCMNGESRSATAVAAYMMAEMGMSAKEALTTMRKIRPNISPNKGFLEQLKMFENMGCKLEGSTPFHTRFRLRQRQEEREAGYPNGMGEYADDATAAYMKCGGGAVPAEYAGEVVYSCKMCRKWLFLSRNIITHEQKKGFSREKKTQYKKRSKDGTVTDNVSCTSTFVEPLRWMNGTVAMEGRLECPNEKCKSKLGNFSWVGSNCSCGAFITPSFQISTSRVDHIKLGR
mmetsp:Transcript_47476/g.122911  ORF Transcript_47476/g.122911 Transcript_47476/m.122911 type:complete len:282 (-) Transcript_47476:146-991(-)